MGRHDSAIFTCNYDGRTAVLLCAIRRTAAAVESEDEHAGRDAAVGCLKNLVILKCSLLEGCSRTDDMEHT